MNSLTQLIHELHRRSIWQVLLIYLGASWAVLEVTDHIIERFELPPWSYGAALILLLIGLPIVLATAFVQEGTPLARAPDSDEGFETRDGTTPARSVPAAPDSAPSAGAHRLFTWRNAILGGLSAAALWGLVLTAWVALGATGPADVADGAAGSADLTDLALRTQSDIPSVAVLPFANMSQDEDFAFFADGVHEDILTNLSKSGGLLVVSRTSTLQYRGTEKSIREIGAELGADAVLEGSVRRFGDDVRITAQLIDTESDTHLWADNFDRKLDNIFALQSEIAIEVANALEARLTPAEARRIHSVPTDDLTAYDLYLEGRQAYNQYRQAENETAIRLFKEAIARDADYALAWAGLADAYAQYVSRWGGALEWADSAHRAGLRATELDPESSQAFKALALALSMQDDDLGSVAALERALELDPNNAHAANNLGVSYGRLGRWDDSARWYRVAIRLEPDNIFAHGNLAIQYARLQMYDRALDAVRLGETSGGQAAANMWGEWHVRYSRGETDAAVALADRRVAADPGNVAVIGEAAFTHLWAGDLETAESRARDVLRLRPDAPPNAYKGARTVLASVALTRGDAARGRELLAESLAEIEEGRESGALPSPWVEFQLGMLHTLLGYQEEALGWLERSQQAGLNWEALWLQEAAVDPLRGHPRFERILERVRTEDARMREVILADLERRPVA